MKHHPLTPYMFLLPAMILLSAFVFYPALEAFRLSFTDYNIINPPQYVGTENYEKLWKDGTFWLTLRNTFLYLFVVVPALVVLPLILAIVVNRKLKGIGWFRTAYYVPVVTSMVVAGLAWKWVFAEKGVLNFWLQALGVIDSPVEWLTSENLAIFSVMAVTVWKGLGYYMVIYLAGLQSISKELYEAAKMDGADGWRKHWYVTIPMMKPSILLVAVMSSIAAMKVFEEIYIMTGGGPLNASKTLVFYIYERAFDSLDMGYASAIGCVLFVIVLVLSILQIKIAERREMHV
ncbi:carbohydrate ABC transporter membrane protein 1, CUT1 family [Planifilum fulgidum]|uniref:Carbohydrate ABC transporter membrane protein 1, CUT1 family n=1 Tax=Planifilum fulgidum TaxID=201973 RepID=A0A1I2SJ77_9BACL|nr:sugar ABC transporter permease [Planifilum fulgidum]SFG50276.1 carbohydrate ABC transporter membrane protein 1, CUT1 family [Planifilum fulgidum]